MRVAVSGSHGTGKSTLIQAFLEARPEYAHVPEAYEALADAIDVSPSEGPTPEGMALLMEATLEAQARHPPGARVIFERSPVDYVAYAAASRRTWPADEASGFRSRFAARVREALGHLDLIVFLPVPRRGPLAHLQHENPRFRKRVDERLRSALVEDAYDLFSDGAGPLVVELSGLPEQQLAQLLRLTAPQRTVSGGRRTRPRP